MLLLAFQQIYAMDSYYSLSICQDAMAYFFKQYKLYRDACCLFHIKKLLLPEVMCLYYPLLTAEASRPSRPGATVAPPPSARPAIHSAWAETTPPLRRPAHGKIPLAH